MVFFGMVALLSAVTLASGQDRPASTSSEAAQNAEKRTNELSILASSLEQKVARMLPCDPRVRTAIEEVSRASEARFAALIAYWQEIAKRSSGQAETARMLIADNDARRAEWRADRADSEQEQTRLGTQTSDLRESARQQAALATAARVLNGISQNTAAAAKQTVTREEASAKLDASLKDLIKATQARQTAIENEVKALGTENDRWTAYYAARIMRAQMECSITGPPGASDSASPRAPKKGK